MLLFSVAGGLTEARAGRRDLLARAVGDGRLRSAAQVAAALDFVKKRTPDAPIDAAEFDAACGVGVAFTEAQVRERGAAVVAAAGAALTDARYLYPLHTLLTAAKEGPWKWADGRALKEAVDAAVLAALGPRGPEDDAREAAARAAGKGHKATAAAAGAAGAAALGGAASGGAASGGAASGAAAGGAAGGAAPGGAPGGAPAAAAPSGALAAGAVVEGALAARELAAAVNSPALLAAHAAATGGVLRTRFPPEPNGFLHIGHAKSMNLNFEGAFRALGAPGGVTIFRYDDTNPDAETREYIENMAENVAWMGWRPAATTRTSDYFPQLHAFAVELIKRGGAYVCHQSRAEMEASRDAARARDGRSPDSPWRDRPAAESLAEFDAMRRGCYAEGAATLRLRVDMAAANPTLWDPVAYRIKYAPHPHTGDAWCIYPSYDFSHPLVDSLEHIDYSLCTLEFEVRRDLYYWTLARLDLWRPHVWEFARLNITHVQLSKRKILKLVNDRRVRGWDDPRLPTLNGLRRRGYTPEAINAFCRDIGVTRHDNVVQYSRLEHHVRAHLDIVARRDFVVLRPLRLVLENVPADAPPALLPAPDFPRDAASRTHPVALSRVVYIEADDFRAVDSPDFYGLAPGKVAGLRYAGYVRATGHDVDPATGAVTEVRGVYDAARSPGFAGRDAAGRDVRVRGNLSFASGDAPFVEVRLYGHLFATEVPGSTGDWEAELAPDSETVLPRARANPHLLAPGVAPPGSHIQAERVGFFVVDRDSDVAPDETGARVRRLVLNLTLGLKEAKEAGGAAGGAGKV